MSTDSKIDKKEITYDMEALKAKADLLGITYGSRINAATLKEKIDLHLEPVEDEPVEESKIGKQSIGPNKSIRQIEKEARKLVSVIITDNSQIDIDNPTIIHGVQNAFFKIGPVIIKKEVEQDVPKAIIDSLKVKTMVKWVPSINTITKRPTGNKIAETRKRYSIEYL